MIDNIAEIIDKENSMKKSLTDQYVRYNRKAKMIIETKFKDDLLNILKMQNYAREHDMTFHIPCAVGTGKEEIDIFHENTDKLIFSVHNTIFQGVCRISIDNSGEILFSSDNRHDFFSEGKTLDQAFDFEKTEKKVLDLMLKGIPMYINIANDAIKEFIEKTVSNTMSMEKEIDSIDEEIRSLDTKEYDFEME